MLLESILLLLAQLAIHSKLLAQPLAVHLSPLPHMLVETSLVP
jgi:hypothetical protein